MSSFNSGNKINLAPITKPQDVSVLNDNFQQLQEHLNDKVFYRNNPNSWASNSLQNPLDANGNPIYNLRKPIHSHEPVRLIDLVSAGGGAVDGGMTQYILDQLELKIDKPNGLNTEYIDGTGNVQNFNNSVSNAAIVIPAPESGVRLEGIITPPEIAARTQGQLDFLQTRDLEIINEIRATNNTLDANAYRLGTVESRLNTITAGEVTRKDLGVNLPTDAQLTKSWVLGSSALADYTEWLTNPDTALDSDKAGTQYVQFEFTTSPEWLANLGGGHAGVALRATPNPIIGTEGAGVAVGYLGGGTSLRVTPEFWGKHPESTVSPEGWRNWLITEGQSPILEPNKTYRVSVAYTILDPRQGHGEAFLSYSLSEWVPENTQMGKRWKAVYDSGSILNPNIVNRDAVPNHHSVAAFYVWAQPVMKPHFFTNFTTSWRRVPEQYVPYTRRADNDGSGGIPDAPSDGNTYGRRDGSWSVITGGTGSVPEAPNDGQNYVRRSLGWHVLPASTTPNISPTALYSVQGSTSVTFGAMPVSGSHENYVSTYNGMLFGKAWVGGNAGNGATQGNIQNSMFYDSSVDSGNGGWVFRMAANETEAKTRPTYLSETVQIHPRLNLVAARFFAVADDNSNNTHILRYSNVERMKVVCGETPPDTYPVGALVMAMLNNTFTMGYGNEMALPISGVQLTPANAAGVGAGAITSGTWRCLGYSGGTTAPERTTLWQRIA